MDQTTDKNMSNFEIKLRKYAALFDTNTTKHQHMEIMDHLFDKELLIVYSKISDQYGPNRDPLVKK